MRKLMIIAAIAAVAGCGISKQQYGAKEAEAAKYKQALQDESGKVAALETKAQSLEQQNAALKSQVGGLEQQLTKTSSQKAELEVTTAKLTEEYSKSNEELQKKLTVRINDRLQFAEKSSKLSVQNKQTLDAIADAIKGLKDKTVVVAGYTDDVEVEGKDIDVRKWQLSTARALEVAKYLTTRGVDAKRIGIAGFGEGRPAAANESLQTRAGNRRVEIALTPADHKAIGTVEVKPAELKK